MNSDAMIALMIMCGTTVRALGVSRKRGKVRRENFEIVPVYIPIPIFLKFSSNR
jgi:hypothetical protein